MNGIWITEQTVDDKASYLTTITERDINDLPQGDVLVEVQYSSLNYKDALSAAGNKGVTRNYPHQPGIDAAGVVAASDVAEFALGDAVIVTGFDLGMNTAGGLGQFIRVPKQWLVPKPNGLSLQQAMQLGTAGLTAGLCLQKLEQMGLKPSDGDVLVTGGSGGVGAIAVSLLAAKGYAVVACTGKPQHEAALMQLGAKAVIGREMFSDNARPLLKPLYAAAIDVAGGITLASILKQIKPAGSVACCGLADGGDLPSTVLPFILRGINLLGVDSVEIDALAKQQVWHMFAGCVEQLSLDSIAAATKLEKVPKLLSDFFKDDHFGRYWVDLGEVAD